MVWVERNLKDHVFAPPAVRRDTSRQPRSLQGRGPHGCLGSQGLAACTGGTWWTQTRWSSLAPGAPAAFSASWYRFQPVRNTCVLSNRPGLIGPHQKGQTHWDVTEREINQTQLESKTWWCLEHRQRVWRSVGNWTNYASCCSSSLLSHSHDFTLSLPIITAFCCLYVP